MFQYRFVCESKYGLPFQEDSQGNEKTGGAAHVPNLIQGLGIVDGLWFPKDKKH